MERTNATFWDWNITIRTTWTASSSWDIDDVDKEEEWDIKEEGEEKPQEAAAQKENGRRCIWSQRRWSEARNGKKYEQKMVSINNDYSLHGKYNIEFRSRFEVKKKNVM